MFVTEKNWYSNDVWGPDKALTSLQQGFLEAPGTECVYHPSYFSLEMYKGKWLKT